MRRNLLDHVTDSLESVAFQSDDFFVALTKAFSLSMKEGQSRPGIKRLSKSLSGVIKEFTKMTMDVVIKESEYFDASAFILPVHIEKFFDLYTPSIDRESDIKRKKKVYAGGVDPRTGKVTGAFSNIVTTLEITTHAIYGQVLSEEELAAILLHEIGHVFTTLLLATSYTHGLRVFDQVSKGYAEVDTFGERVAILKRATETAGSEKVSPKEIEQAVALDYGKDNGYPASAALIIRLTQGDIDAVSPAVTEYTGRVLEQMADEYAARYGAGKHLAQALDKLFDDDSFRSGFKGFWSRTSSSLSVVLIALILAASHIVAGAVFAFMALAVGVLAAWLGDPMYDTPRTRFDKLLQQLSMKAKNKGTSKEERLALTEEYKTMKEIRDKYSDSIGIFATVITHLVPSFRRRAHFSAAMAELEKLASNELYIQSQKFRTV